MVSRQLGHRDATMALKVYGRFVPRAAEWDYWREKVSQLQAEKLGAFGTAHGTGQETPSDVLGAETPSTAYEREGYDDSRGGTRTRDPGIMSAVL